jgi:FkbM family methyltransferase
VNAFEKAQVYLRASAALRNLNLKGLPFLPRTLFTVPLHNRGAYNEFVTWIYLLRLDSARWIVDVGANHGDFAEAAAAYFPEANILLVEPLPQLHDELQRRCARHSGKWLLEKFAVGAEEDVLPLHVAADQDAIGSLAGFSPEYQRLNPQSEITQISCKVRQLDAVAAEREISCIDLLKIDVEGFEFEVVKGAARALEFTRALIVEVSLVRRPTDVTNPLVAMLDLLTTYGFQVVNVLPSLFDLSCPWKPVEFNILARKSEAACMSRQESLKM